MEALFYIAGFVCSVVCLLKKKRRWKPALFLLAGSLAALGMWAASKMQQKEGSLKEIRRAEKTGAETRVELEAEAEGEIRSIQISIAPQAYERNELQRLSETLWEKSEKKPLPERRDIRLCERGHEFTGICGRVSVSPEMQY